jgi:hypothetical protein
LPVPLHLRHMVCPVPSQVQHFSSFSIHPPFQNYSRGSERLLFGYFEFTVMCRGKVREQFRGIYVTCGAFGVCFKRIHGTRYFKHLFAQGAKILVNRHNHPPNAPKIIYVYFPTYILPLM